MTSMPASRRLRAMIFAPRSWPSRPGFAMTMRIGRSGSGAGPMSIPQARASRTRPRVSFVEPPIRRRHAMRSTREEVRRRRWPRRPTCLVVVRGPPPPCRSTGPAAAVDAALGRRSWPRAVKDGRSTARPARPSVFHAADGLAAPRGRGGRDRRRRGARTGARPARRRRGPPRAVKAADRRPGAAATTPAPPRWARFVEGLGTGVYRFDRFKTTGDARKAAPGPAWPSTRRRSRSADLRRADRVVEAVNARARPRSTRPSNHLTPTMLADHAQGAGRRRSRA